MSVIEALSPKVAYVNLGCRVNRVELDDIASDLEDYGCLSSSAEDADLVVVNSCAVTGEAEAKTRKAIRRALALEHKPQVIATGCVAMLMPEELKALSSRLIIEPDKSRIVPLVLAELGLSELGGCTLPDGVSVTPTGRTRPGIKIQDGCDCKCSFCIVWKARGPSRSVPYEEVLAKVNTALDRGAQELVLTGINLGRYEHIDEQAKAHGLDWLLNRLLEDTNVGRLRLSSIEPNDVSAEMLKVMSSSDGRVAPFLHLPLQSGCDATLKRMRRACNTATYARVASLAREAISNLALCCDVIVGFPGEDDAEFEESIAFCEEVNFARMHVFRYSRRPGTPAASMEDQVDPRVSAARAKRMRDLAAEMRLLCAQELVGKDDLVVIQAPGRGVTGGLFDAIVNENLEVGSLQPVHVASVNSDGILITN